MTPNPYTSPPPPMSNTLIFLNKMKFSFFFLSWNPDFFYPDTFPNTTITVHLPWRRCKMGEVVIHVGTVSQRRSSGDYIPIITVMGAQVTNHSTATATHMPWTFSTPNVHIWEHNKTYQLLSFFIYICK